MENPSHKHKIHKNHLEALEIKIFSSHIMNGCVGRFLSILCKECAIPTADYNL